MVNIGLTRTLVMSITLLFADVPIVFAQPDTLWTKTFGGGSFDGGVSVRQTSDGGFIITGLTFSYGAGSSDVWLIKTNVSGDTLWTKTFGGRGGDVGVSVRQTSDGGFIITGLTASYGAGSTDVWLIKTDVSGDTLWTKTFGGSSIDQGWSVQQTSDGGFIITGSTASYGAGSFDVWLIKTNVSGDTLWTKTFGSIGEDQGLSVQQTSDGGYIITATTRSYGAGSTDVWLIKTDVSGDTLWTKTFGGSSIDQGYSVHQTSDGGYIVVGSTESYGAGYRDYPDVWLIRTNASGDTVWTRTFGGSDRDEGFSVQQTSDGGYIITATTRSYGAGFSNIWLIKTNASGDTLWTRTFGESNENEGFSIQQTSDGGYIITGYTESYGAGYRDVWLIRLASDTGLVFIEDGPNVYPSSFLLYQNYPNPFNPTTTLRYDLPARADVVLTIYDILGRQVRTLVQSMEEPGSKSVIWDGTDDFDRPVSAGVYLYQIQAGSSTHTRKMVLLR